MSDPERPGNSRLTGPGRVGTIGTTVNRLANRLMPAQTAAVTNPARRPPAGPR
jgi:hypothetical protein